MAKAIQMIRDRRLYEQALSVAELAGKATDPQTRRDLHLLAMWLWQESICKLYAFER